MVFCADTTLEFCLSVDKRQSWLPLQPLMVYGCLAKYRVRKGSISRNKLEMLKFNFNIYYKILGFNFIKSTGYMLVFLKEHFLVKKKQVKKI